MTPHSYIACRAVIVAVFLVFVLLIGLGLSDRGPLDGLSTQLTDRLFDWSYRHLLWPDRS
jgi:hypothetical protein